MVQIKGLSHSFGEKSVLKNVDLTISEGEIVALMGSSGGGKTTLLRCLSGLIRATKGEIIVDGVNVIKKPEDARRRMGMVFQQAALFDYMSVEENVLFGVQRHTKEPKETHKACVARALERVGLKGHERKMPSELSGGMKKRVGIARALALNPKLMLYDEPTTGLDPITTYTIDHLIVELREQIKVTSVVVSHDVSSVFRTADRIIFLHEGSVIFDGPPDDFAKADHPNIVELVHKSRAVAFDLD